MTANEVESLTPEAGAAVGALTGFKLDCCQNSGAVSMAVLHSNSGSADSALRRQNLSGIVKFRDAMAGWHLLHHGQA
ncbi:MAG: hypothetical protein VB858_21460 [Planctomycetaceae bacterium]